ncbi:hypothetical protein SynBIOSU31_00886 [Synechococcus sp. BIOS-U3-1]|uniref:hypothetical protein n=1 Tax=Synechococcus sp. BIOS-U3-1 TaxID=1400865 RepID=UPI0016450888|nr:hypothetical protein [Synechococcus sp. BIOS-U3-1]QNI57772.1 hypothetical protein SynBIOSU31_00886 [Synechococcus sp. BIOS-U3-1]
MALLILPSVVLRPVVVALVLLLSSAGSVHALEDCSLIKRLMNTLGASMARNRMLIAASQQTGDNKVQAEEASELLSRQTRNYRDLREDYERNRCGRDWE